MQAIVNQHDQNTELANAQQRNRRDVAAPKLDFGRHQDCRRKHDKTDGVAKQSQRRGIGLVDGKPGCDDTDADQHAGGHRGDDGQGA